MQKFTMTCSCGYTMTVEAAHRDDAVMQFKAMMNEEGIATHMAEKHPGEAVMSVAACHEMIAEQVAAA